MKAPALVFAAALLLTGCDRFTSVETRIERASIKLAAGEHQAALVELRKALNDHPENLSAQLLLVDTLGALGETEAALYQLDLASAAGASPDQTEARRIELLIDSRQIGPARAALETSTTISAERRNLFEGLLSMSEQRPAEAKEFFDRALTANPRFTKAALGRVEALIAQGKAVEAQAELEQIMKNEPTSAHGWLLRGQLAARAGEFGEAAEAFAASITHGKSLKRSELLIAHVHHVESLLAADQLAQARSAVESLAAVAGTAPIVSFVRAKVLLASHETSAAVNELRTFTQAAPAHLPGRLLLVSALLQQGNTEQAYAEALRNVAEFGRHDEPRLALARIELEMGRFSDAEETLQPLIGRSPPDPMATAILAELGIRRGEAIAGVSLLERSLADQPESARLRLQLAAAYLSIGQAKRALETLEPINDEAHAAARDRMRVIATAALSGASEAERELDAAVARHPEDVELLLMAATYYANLQRWDSARSYIERARMVRPEDPLLEIALGRLELAAGNLDEAESHARDVLEKVPDDVGAMMLIANVAAHQGKDEEVDGWLNRARIANPRALDVSVALARRAVARGASREARNILSDAVRLSPWDPRARIVLAELDASMGQYDEAMKELRTAAADMPASPPILLAMSKVQLASKDLDAARKSLKAALTAAPGWLPAATLLVALEASVGNQNAALDVVRELRRIDPRGAASHVLEGDVHMAAKRPADAAAAFVSAYRISPSAALAARAARAKAVAKLPDAENELVDWIKRAPHDMVARRALADYYIAAARHESAIEHLEIIVAARPNDAEALNNLAWAYRMIGDERALPIAERAYAAAPNSAAIADTYGWILVQAGRLAEGVKILGNATKLAPENGQMQYHLAFGLSRMGETQRARAILQSLMSRGTTFESLAEAKQLLATLDGE